jgi:hypothetical protein
MTHIDLMSMANQAGRAGAAFGENLDTHHS